MLNKIKGVYEKKIKSILVIQTLMFIIGITVLTKGYFDDFSPIYLKIVFIILAANGFLSGIENILLKSNKWLYRLDFFFGTLFVVSSLFFFN